MSHYTHASHICTVFAHIFYLSVSLLRSVEADTMLACLFLVHVSSHSLSLCVYTHTVHPLPSGFAFFFLMHSFASPHEATQQLL